jgi:hypothetical protein
MFRATTAAACLLTALPLAAPAVDLATLGGLEVRAACVAYALIDLGARQRSGAISPEIYRARAATLGRAVAGQAGRPNAGLERRIDEMMERIAAEQPDTAEVTVKSGACRAILGL